MDELNEEEDPQEEDENEAGKIFLKFFLHLKKRI